MTKDPTETREEKFFWLTVSPVPVRWMEHVVKTPHMAVDQEGGSDQEQRQTSNDHSY